MLSLSYSIAHAVMHDGIEGTRGDDGRSRVGILCNLLVLRNKGLSYSERLSISSRRKLEQILNPTRRKLDGGFRRGFEEQGDKARIT